MKYNQKAMAENRERDREGSKTKGGQTTKHCLALVCFFFFCFYIVVLTIYLHVDDVPAPTSPFLPPQRLAHLESVFFVTMRPRGRLVAPTNTNASSPHSSLEMCLQHILGICI